MLKKTRSSSITPPVLPRLPRSNTAFHRDTANNATRHFRFQAPRTTTLHSHRDMDMPAQIEQIASFELIRKLSEAAYSRDPRDADNLTRWGGALLELSSYQQPSTAKKMLKDAISKFEKALEIDSKKCVTMRLLGSALLSSGFMIPDAEEAGEYFLKATAHFATACEMEPHNQLYRKSLEMVAKAPEIHAEIQKEVVAREARAASTGPSSSSSAKTATKKGKNSDLIYDVMGWVILGVAVVAWVGFARKNMSPPPPPF